MTDDQAPPPLKSNGETPAELVRALTALGRTDARDLARLARVGARLDAAALASNASSGWLKGLAGSKAGLIGIVVGALGALGALGYSLYDRGPVESAQPKVAIPPPAPPATLAPSPQLEHAVETQRRIVDETDPTLSVLDRAQDANGASRDQVRPLRTAREPRASKPAVSTMDANDSSEPVEAPAPAPIEHEPAAEADAPVVPVAKPALPLSEAALIYKARSAAADEPQTALRLLEEHAQRFPNGTLVPEREVLAIEVLRKIGRHAEAARRMRAFEARYPGSIHLRRLAPNAD